MPGEATRPSLLLAGGAHHHHNHEHQKFHKRQQSSVAPTAVTEVIQTIDVVQSVEVDSTGSTIAVTDVALDPTVNLNTISFASAPTTPASTSFTDAASTAPAVDASQSLLSSSPGTTTTVTPSTTFASFIGSTNSSSVITKSATSSGTFSNSTTSLSLSSALSSATLLTHVPSSNATDSGTSSSFSSTSSSASASSSSSSTSSSGPTTITFPNGTPAGAGTSAVSGSSSTSTAAAGSGGSSDSTTPTTPVLVGSVVGSVAGVAFILLALLFILRWRKKHQNMLPLDSVSRGPIEGGGDTAPGSGPPSQPSRGMTERRSILFAVPAAFATLAGHKRSSQRTDRTVSSTAGSERGFYRVSGRKLPSVLRSGGDGYGGGVDPDTATLSGTSFYRDSQGFYGGPGSPPLVRPGTRERDSGIPVMRPSPARTPVTEQGPFTEPSAEPPPLVPPRRPDALGRSHPSQDGSHTSRFTEEV